MESRRERRAHCHPRHWLAATLVVAAWSSACLTPAIVAQDTATATAKFSPDVVAKAEGILDKAGLRQAGKSIQATGISDIGRAISGLAREKRELRLLQKDWQDAADQVSKIRNELQRLNVQSGELSLQLARVAGVDVAANNRIVGLLNATQAQTKTLTAERERVKEEMASRRAKLNEAEAAYAETVLAIRKEFTATRDAIATALDSDDVKIALKVMSTNFETPKEVSADDLLATLDKRIERIEQEVFSETIPLIVERRSLYVDVVVGRKATRMVVDSGATMICLPQKSAVELGVVVPLDAREVKLVLANGDSIPARAVTLPRVRVGEFEAENVDACVLDASATDAEPLLGMSFLDNFKFELNPAERTLKMLRVNSE